MSPASVRYIAKPEPPAARWEGMTAMTEIGKMGVKCTCGETGTAAIYETVNAKINPELRERLLAGRLNLYECPNCGAEHVLPSINLLYHDMQRRFAVLLILPLFADEAARIRQFGFGGVDEGITGSPSSYLDRPHVVSSVEEMREYILEREGLDRE